MKRFTEEEDIIIIREVKKCPSNLSKAFQEAANKLSNRTEAAVTGRWYNTLRAKQTVITTGSAAGFTKNVKNLQRNVDGSMPEQHLKGVEFIMKELLTLSTEERKLIINFFQGTNVINQ